MYKNILLVIAFMISTPAFAFQNEPDGFRGIHWGDDQILHAEQLEEVDRNNDLIAYKRKDDSLNIGGAELTRITYGYKHEKLFMVLIHTEGISNRRALIDAFKEQFGRGSKPNKYLEKYLWTGSKTGIMIDCNAIRDTCTASLFSTAGMKADREESKSKAKEAAKDF